MTPTPFRFLLIHWNTLCYYFCHSKVNLLECCRLFSRWLSYVQAAVEHGYVIKITSVNACGDSHRSAKRQRSATRCDERKRRRPMKNIIMDPLQAVDKASFLASSEPANLWRYIVAILLSMPTFCRTLVFGNFTTRRIEVRSDRSFPVRFSFTKGFKIFSVDELPVCSM